MGSLLLIPNLREHHTHIWPQSTCCGPGLPTLLISWKERPYTRIHMKDNTADSTEDFECLTKRWKEKQVEQPL